MGSHGILVGSTAQTAETYRYLVPVKAVPKFYLMPEMGSFVFWVQNVGIVIHTYWYLIVRRTGIIIYNINLI